MNFATTYRPAAAPLWSAVDELLGWGDPAAPVSLSPRTRIAESEKAFTVEMELPGVKKEDIKAEVENGVLTVTAQKKTARPEKDDNIRFSEISYGEYTRSFRLGDEVEAGNVKAALEDGVLRLELEKKAKAQALKIEVK